MYGKLGFMILFIFSDIRMACWFTFTNFCLWILIENPKYTGATKIIKPKSFAELESYFDLEEIHRLSKQKNNTQQ